MKKLSARDTLMLILLLGFALRLGGAFVWQARLDQRFGFPDSESYWDLGRSIAEAAPYQFGPYDFKVFRSPGYPVILAPLFVIGGPDVAPIWARLQAALFGTLTVAAVWWLGRMLFDEYSGLLAAGICALYPGAIAASVFVLSEAPFCTLMVLQLALWTVACRAENGKKAASFALFAGIVAAGATLVKPSWLLFTPGAAALGAIIGGAGTTRMKQVCIGICMLAGLIVGMCPWWIRNARVTGHFVPTTLQVGASLYDGLNPNATGASNMRFVEPITAEELEAYEGPRDGFEYHLDRRFREWSLAWAFENKATAAELAWIKFLRIWNIWPNEPSLSSWPIKICVFLTFVPIAIFGILGALRTVRLGWPYILCWLPAVYFTMLHVVFIGSIRYRQPAMLGLIVLAAGAVGTSCWVRGERARK